MPSDLGIPVLGTTSELLMIASKLKPDRMVISRRGLSHGDILEFVGLPACSRSR